MMELNFLIFNRCVLPGFRELTCQIVRQIRKLFQYWGSLFLGSITLYLMSEPNSLDML